MLSSTFPSFSAELMDGQSAALRAVSVMFDIATLRLVDAASGDSVGAWPLSELRIERVARDVFHVRHRQLPGAVLSVRQPGFAAALARSGVPGARAAADGRRRLRMGAAYAGGIAAVVAVVYSLLPALSSVIARRVPFEVEERLGLQIEGFFADRACRSPGATRALAHLAARLQGPPGSPTVNPDALTVINLEMVNAFTFPGGRIMMTRGLLEKAESPDEVAGVLAHELSHVRERHIMAQIIRSSLLSIGWSVTVGDFSGLFVLDPSTMFNIATLSFSRQDERAADRGALGILDRARISRTGFAAFFQRMSSESDGIPAWLSTHPASAERLTAIRSGGASDGDATPALGTDDWKALKAACRDTGAATPPGRHGQPERR